MNNALILATTPLWTVHHAESIELTHRLAKTSRVFYVVCQGDLSSCPANRENQKVLCEKCRRESNYTKRNLLPQNTQFIPLEIHKKAIGKVAVDILSIEDLLNFEYDSVPIGRLVASQIAGEEKGEYFNVKRNQSKIARLINDGVALYEFVNEFILQHRISEVYAWNGRRQSDGPALYAAKNNKIAYYAYISGGKRGNIFVLKSLSVQNFLERSRDKKKLTDDVLLRPGGNKEIERGAAQYFEQYRLGTLNQVGYKYYSQVNDDKFTFNGKKKILLIATSSPKEHIHQDQYNEYFGNDPYGKFLAIIDNQQIYEKYHVVVRWHPFNRNNNAETKNRIQELIRKYTMVVHYPPESNVNTYEIVAKAEVIYATGSTVAQFAAYQGKAVLIYGPSAVMFGESVFQIDDHSEALELLMSNGLMRNRNKADIEKLAYYSMNFGEPMLYVCPEVNKHHMWYLKDSLTGKKRPISKKSLFSLARRLVANIVRRIR